jgi:hypothetical protein
MAANEAAYYNQLSALTELLQQVGFPMAHMAYFLAQIMHETGNMTSDLAQSFNNFSGIKYVHQAAANGQHNGFATYATPADWAQDYKRVLSRGARPIDAASAQDFFHRLTTNGYFLPSEAPAYVKGFNARLKKINQVLSDAAATGQQYANGAMNTYTTGAGLKKGDIKAANTSFDAGREATALQHWVSDHKLLAGGAAAAFLLLLLSR